MALSSIFIGSGSILNFLSPYLGWYFAVNTKQNEQVKQTKLTKENKELKEQFNN